MICDMVESVGWTFDVAENGKVALDLIAQRSNSAEGQFSCVVSDCIMPILDGWQLTRKIRQLPYHKLPVIGLTGSVSEEDLARCEEVGMDHVLTKPVKLADLVKTVQDVVQTARAAAAAATAVAAAAAKQPVAGLAIAGLEQLPYVLLVDDDEFNLSIVQVQSGLRIQFGTSAPVANR